MLTFTFHASPMIGNGADDPGFFVPKYFGLSINFIFCQTGKDFFLRKNL